MKAVFWLTFGKHYSAAAGTVGKCRSNSRRVVFSATGRDVLGRNSACLADSGVLSNNSGSTQANGKE